MQLDSVFAKLNSQTDLLRIPVIEIANIYRTAKAVSHCLDVNNAVHLDVFDIYISTKLLEKPFCDLRMGVAATANFEHARLNTNGIYDGMQCRLII